MRHLLIIPSILVAMAVSALLSLVVATPASAADAGACYSISSADGRAYCLAKAHKDPSSCYSIQSADLRASCLAEVRP